MPRSQSGYEQFPEPARTTPAHRHPPAVPGVEIADDADRAGIGRPHRKGDALDPVMHDRVRAELLVAGEVIALGEQVQVEFAKHRRKAIDVVEFARDAAGRHPQPITKRFTTIGNFCDEEALGMEFGRRPPRSRRWRFRLPPFVACPATGRVRKGRSRFGACPVPQTDRRDGPRRSPSVRGQGAPLPVSPPRIALARRGAFRAARLRPAALSPPAAFPSLSTRLAADQSASPLPAAFLLFRIPRIPRTGMSTHIGRFASS